MLPKVANLFLWALLWEICSSQIISTIVSNNPNQTSAIFAPLIQPGGILNANGGLYIADYCMLYFVNFTSNSSTIVAGNASTPCNSQPTFPIGVALQSQPHYYEITYDKNGNILMGCVGGFGIRRLNISSKFIDRIVGSDVVGYSGDGTLTIIH